MKLVKNFGEFNLINKIRSLTGTDRSVIRGIGDDTAVLKFGNSKKHLLFTCDMLIEDVHFRLKSASFEKIGHKALGCSISDIAAMGGIPKWAVVSAGIPGKLKVKDIEKIYMGIKALAKKFDVNIVGGDTVRSDKLVLDVSMIGEVNKDELVLRSTARVGDIIFVTGFLGGSIKEKHLSFTPRLDESRILVKKFQINSMMDISDGLAGDLRRILDESSVGAAISEALIPVSRDAGSVEDALCDGEDFELLFTVNEVNALEIIKNFKKYSKLNITPVGKIMPKSFGYKLINRDGMIVPLTKTGFTHF